MNITRQDIGSTVGGRIQKRRITNVSLTPFIETFEDESSARLAYLAAHPNAPNIQKKLVRNMFDNEGTAILEEADVDILQRFCDRVLLSKPQHAIWQVPNKAVFVALFHLTAGSAACVTMPRGVYAIGGSVTAALAVPVFEDVGFGDVDFGEVERFDFEPLSKAGRAIGRHLERAKWWRRVSDDFVLKVVGSFLGYDKVQLPAVVDRILKNHKILSTGVIGPPNNWGWWLADDGRAPYARTDVDFYITADTLEEAQLKAEALRVEIKEVIGDHVAVKTPNTLTLCPPFPERHSQIVLTVHRDLMSVLLFADLDSTTAAYDGSNVFACERFIRAVRTGTNLIPVGMWEQRRDTVIRTAKYARRGFGALLTGGAERRDEDIVLLRHAACFEPEYFTAAGEEDECQVLLQLEKNTAYIEYKIPRGPGVTPSIVRSFLSQRGADEKIFVDSQPLRCEWRLSRRPEAWVSWGSVVSP